METKNCITCKEDKPLDQFSKCSRKPDGKQPSCKACNKITNAKFREKRPGYQVKYYYTPDGHKAKLKAQAKFWSKAGGGIYVLINKVNNNIYVGQTSQFNRREVEWRMYTRNPHLMSRYLNQSFKDAIVRYGHESFEWKVIEEMPNATLRQRRQRENHYIETFSLITEVYNKNKNK